MRDLDQEQIDFYLGLEPEQAACRGRRRHDFPVLVPGKFELDHTLIERVSGVYQVTQHCRRGCGRSVKYLTDRNGVIDYTTAQYGGGGKNYLATGLGLTAGDDRMFLAYSQAETVREIAALQAKQAS